MTTETPLRQREFGPEMQPTAAEVTLIEAAGFEDNSWGNDICISFERACTFHDRPDGTTLRLWIDAINPDDREMLAERFAVQAYIDCEVQGEAFETDSLNEALAVAKEVLESHEAPACKS